MVRLMPIWWVFFLASAVLGIFATLGTTGVLKGDVETPGLLNVTTVDPRQSLRTVLWLPLEGASHFIQREEVVEHVMLPFSSLYFSWEWLWSQGMWLTWGTWFLSKAVAPKLRVMTAKGVLSLFVGIMEGPTVWTFSSPERGWIFSLGTSSNARAYR